MSCTAIGTGGAFGGQVRTAAGRGDGDGDTAEFMQGDAWTRNAAKKTEQEHSGAYRRHSHENVGREEPRSLLPMCARPQEAACEAHGLRSRSTPADALPFAAPPR